MARKPATPANFAGTPANFPAARDRGTAVEVVEGRIVEKAASRPEHGIAQTKVGELVGPFHRRAGGSKGPGGGWIISDLEAAYPQTKEVFRHDIVGFRRDRHSKRPVGLPVTARPD